MYLLCFIEVNYRRQVQQSPIGETILEKLYDLTGYFQGNTVVQCLGTAASQQAGCEFDPKGLWPLCVEFAWSPCVCVGSSADV